MTLTTTVQKMLEQFTQSTGLTLGAVSSRSLNEGKALRNFMEGRRSMTLGRVDLLLQWLSDNWPKNADWPQPLPRPLSRSSVMLDAPKPPETAEVQK